jgi:hypothetical protein
MALSLNAYTQSQKDTSMKTESNAKYTILVLYRVNHHWLALSREERNAFYENSVLPIIQKFEGKLSVRLFDSEAFHAQTSDYMIVECHDLKDYYYFMEYLRDTELFSKPYMVLNDVIIGMENGFQDFEADEYGQ